MLGLPPYFETIFILCNTMQVVYSRTNTVHVHVCSERVHTCTCSFNFGFTSSKFKLRLIIITLVAVNNVHLKYYQYVFSFVYSHESGSGYYRVSAYFLCKILVDLIPMRLIPLLGYGSIIYFMMGECKSSHTLRYGLWQKLSHLMGCTKVFTRTSKILVLPV